MIEFDHTDTVVRSIRTAAGDVGGDHFVLAAGSWTTPLAAKLGVKIPMEPGKGYSFLLTPKQMPRHGILFADIHAGVTPLGDRVRIGGTMEFSGYDLAIDERRISNLFELARGYVDIEKPEYEEPWAGLRPMTVDGLPILDWAQPYRNAYLATGYSMLGMTVSPPAGEAMAEMIVTGTRPDVFEPFRVDRFPRAIVRRPGPDRRRLPVPHCTVVVEDPHRQLAVRTDGAPPPPRRPRRRSRRASGTARGRRRSDRLATTSSRQGTSAAHHLLDQEVRRREREVDVDGGRDRAERVVRRHRHERRLGHRGDLAQLPARRSGRRRAGATAQARPREQLPELPAVDEPLAGGDRDRRVARATRASAVDVARAGTAPRGTMGRTARAPAPYSDRHRRRRPRRAGRP